MSTYQGERWVAQQLRSILDQLPANGKVIVRDDGSSDGTVQAIEALHDQRVIVCCGRNLGFSASFLTLLQRAPDDSDMVMLSDQDDVWLPDKIERAWAWICAQGRTPALYGSTQQLVDSRLKPLNVTANWRSPVSFAAALCENRLTGCTAALNGQALAIIKRSGVPRGVRFHDWWMYALVAAFGTVWIDPRPTLLYRQHELNQIGHGAGWWGRHLRIVRFLWKNDWVGILLAQVHALSSHYLDALPPHHRAVLDANFRVTATAAVPRWGLILGTQRFRESLPQEAAFRILLALHRLHLWPLPHRRLRFGRRDV